MGLGGFPGETGSWATDVCADGNVVVGYARSNKTSRGLDSFIWTKELGMCSLNDMLVNDYGLDLSGWQLTHASGISADGKTIVGSGINPDGNNEGWITTIPEPYTLSFLALGGFIKFRTRKR